jgi:parvulin-like peptidyl-prolyl isomerase
LPAQAAKRGQPVDGFAAEVDGRIITVRDVIEETRQEMNDIAQQHQGDAQALARKQEAVFLDGLSRLVERKLMLAKFEKMGAQLPGGTVRDRKESILRDRFDNDRNQLLQILRRMGMTEEQWEQQLRESIIEQSMLQEFVRGKIQITPAEIREAYAQRGEELQSDVELKIRAIAFRPPRPDQEEERRRSIEEVERLLREGADFASVARQYSEGPNAHKGGDQGWVKPDSLPKPIRDALQQVDVGEITERVDLPSQTYFFLVENRRGGEQLPLSEAQAGIENELRSRKYDRLYREFVDSLRAEFPVYQYNPDISAVTGQ